MQATRPLFFAVAVLTLLISACSQPEDFTAPTLEPQFGTADEDRGVDVATVSTGRIYSLSEQFGPNFVEDYDGTTYQNGTYSKVFLKRQDSSGNVIWTRELRSGECDEDWNYDEDYYRCSSVKPISVFADTQGNVSVLTSFSYYYVSDYNDLEEVTYSIQKYDASGNHLSEVRLYDGGSQLNPIDFAVDGSGNYYVARRDGDDATNIVAKYSPSGSLQWQRTSTVGTPSDVAVSSTSVYVVGSAGFARYTTSGNLSWKKTGNFQEVVISGSNLYTRYNKEIRKWDGTGRQLWLRTQSGLNTLVLQAIDGDGSGNVYLSGKYQVSTGNMGAMVRKLSSSGSVLWSRTYGTTAYDDALGIATITGSEIYTTGETQGSFAHTNIGGRDGYLRKANSSGNALWTR